MASIDVAFPIFDSLGNVLLALAKGISWLSGGAFTQVSDGLYTLTNAAGTNAVHLQVGTGTADSSTGQLGITFGTKGQANAVNLGKFGAGATLAVQTGTGQWTNAVASGWGLNGSSGAALGISQSGTVLQLNGASGIQVQGAAKMWSGTGTPEGVVTGSPGDMFMRTNGGAATSLYIKETGSATNTGWVAK